MIPDYIFEIIKKDDALFRSRQKEYFLSPKYNPELHYLHLTKFGYFNILLRLRHYIKLISDYYFSTVVGAVNVDLFMLTTSISSPAGPGSDSEVIPIKFGGADSYLVDSSQFGFEPLLLNDFDKVYCYLPSMRGENFDSRHLNQFFHCEMEMRGDLEDLKPIIEGHVKILCEVFLTAINLTRLISVNPDRTRDVLEKILIQKKFPEVSFEQAINILEKKHKKDLINFNPRGRDITPRGEEELLRLLNVESPVWLVNFDRDRVPFYQKPLPEDGDKTINADLLFPPVIAGAFGGEIVGSGQRQDRPEELYESLRRQGLDYGPYEWYINLRKQKKYQPTSGFGLGIERFIAWALGMDDIKNAIIYPRLKGIITYP